MKFSLFCIEISMSPLITSYKTVEFGSWLRSVSGRHCDITQAVEILIISGDSHC